MRPLQSLVHARTRVRPRYALMPLEGFPVSRLPTWPDAEVRVLASPRLGSEFVQLRVDLPEGKSGHFAADPAVETFAYVLDGVCSFAAGDEDYEAATGYFTLTPPGVPLTITANLPLALIVLRKRYESAEGVERFNPLFGREQDVQKQHWDGNPHSLLQTLVPDDLRYDLAMNIFTFTPGFGLPIVETHVMEHGLYFLQGKGVYFLGDDWMEVEQDDFIWMAPYCPQSFYATGPTPARYLYYKDVNRDIILKS